MTKKKVVDNVNHPPHYSAHPSGVECITITEWFNFNVGNAITQKILEDNEIKRPPVPVKDIIEKAGINVEFVNFKEMGDRIAGFTHFPTKTIYVNARDSLNRQTFTMAHEYGHWILHKSLFEQHPEKYKVLLRTSGEKQNDPLEKEANSFAANLLVPEFLIKPIKDNAILSQLSLMFAVSDDTIKHRLKYV